jgi:hypothetical protein
MLHHRSRYPKTVDLRWRVIAVTAASVLFLVAANGTHASRFPIRCSKRSSKVRCAAAFPGLSSVSRRETARSGRARPARPRLPIPSPAPRHLPAIRPVEAGDRSADACRRCRARASSPFDAVFVPGPAEKMFPRKINEEPILLAAMRESLGQDLLIRTERLEAERILLAVAGVPRNISF